MASSTTGVGPHEKLTKARSSGASVLKLEWKCGCGYERDGYKNHWSRQLLGSALPGSVPRL